jgi:hypothetical protein
MLRQYTIIIAITIGLLFSLGASLQAAPKPDDTVSKIASAAVAAEEGLTVIEDKSLICMVNDRYMGVKQIPVEAEGRIYYGCCAGCVKRIQEDEAIRNAIDPATGVNVDKNLAYTVKDKLGNVMYFESEDTYKQYVPKQGDAAPADAAPAGAVPPPPVPGMGMPSMEMPGMEMPDMPR